MVRFIANFGVDMGSLGDWLVVLKAFFVWVLICAFIGAVIGFVCRDRPRTSIILSLTLTLAFFIFLEWRSPTRAEEWVPNQPFASAAYLIGPFLGLFFAPAALVALFVGRLRRRGRGHATI
jgi:predicted branched-subunit amino acid permease